MQDDPGKEELVKLEEIEQLERLTAEGETLTKESEKKPNQVIVFPLIKRPFFPSLSHAITIERGPYLDILIQAVRTEHKCIGLFLAKPDEIDVANLSTDDLYDKGFLGRISRVQPTENGALVLLLVESRIKADFKNVIKGKKGVLSVPVSYPAPPIKTKSEKAKLEKKAWSQQIIADVKNLVEKYQPLFLDDFKDFLKATNFYSEDEMGKVADFAAGYTTASKEKLQQVIECIDEEERASIVHKLLVEELEVGKIQTDINKKIDRTIGAAQREFFLKEQLKAIKKELGLEKEGKSVDIEKFTERLKGQKVPPEAQKIIDDEIEKLSTLETQSAEYGVCRNYLDWLTILPWDKQSKESFDLEQARKILNEDHYGLEDLKKRIIEFIAVGNLSGGVKGSIICLVGPPGVGKTSIGKSIARALGRKFYRFSVGGMRDEAEIKGHRRTYIGAMPGKMLQALKLTEVNNPVIMLDEVDKLGTSYQGDPASALLEVLDPEQNSQFLDHYLDARFDLSNVLFITTANILDTIPEALRDRMDVLRIAGYLTNEKVEIARNYLVPRHTKDMGLKSADVTFNKQAIREIINGYAREAGVRNLEKAIKKILRQVAVKKVEKSQEKNEGIEIVKQVPSGIKITEKNLVEFLGKPIFTSDRYYEQPPVGVATGLAWTSMGGAVLYIESIKIPAKERSLLVTGQLGDVMKESAQLAYSYVGHVFHKYMSEKTRFFETINGEPYKVHLHVPEGATPKDGPSAGITMAVALLSLLSGRKMKKNVGMTGELTLTGKVLPIGGLREKVLAAKRSGLKEIVCSRENERDWAELSDDLREGMSAHFVDNCEEVFEHVFNFKSPL